MQTVVNGIIQTEHGYAVKNFMELTKQPVGIGRLSFPDYETAVKYLAGKAYPASYRPYLIAVKGMEPDNDTWNNLIFIGQAAGYYDHELGTFKSARQMDMGAATETEVAYLEALDATYRSILAMANS